MGGALLSGVLRCAGCSYILKPDTIGADGSRLRLLVRGERPVASARAASVLGKVIEPFVVETFFRGWAACVPREAGSPKSCAPPRMPSVAPTSIRRLARQRIAGRPRRRTPASRAEGAKPRAARKRWRSSMKPHPGRGGRTAGASEFDNSGRTWMSRSVAIYSRPASMPCSSVAAAGRSTSAPIVLWRGEGPADLPGPGRRLRLAWSAERHARMAAAQDPFVGRGHCLSLLQAGRSRRLPQLRGTRSKRYIALSPICGIG